MKAALIFCMVCALVSISARAQTSFDEYKARLNNEFNAYKKKANEEYDSFRAKANRDYAEFIRRSWVRFDALKSPQRPQDDNPLPPIPYQEKDETPFGNSPIPFDDIIVPEKAKPQPQPILPIEEDPKDDAYFSFVFYGTNVSVRLSDNHRYSLKGCDKNSIASGWEFLSTEKFNNVIADCLKQRRQIGLCDWGYLMFIRELSKSFMGRDCNEARLLMAYIYCQSGYKMKLAYNGNNLYMLYASEHLIFENSHFVVDGIKYYPLDCNESSIYICDASFPNEQPLSLEISRVPNYNVSLSSNRRITSSQYPEVSVDLQVNKNLIDFYSTYPISSIGHDLMTQWSQYANTPISNSVKDNLYPKLRKMLSGLSQLESVERLLNLVQTGLKYGYDSEIWGGERVFFAEESLYYPYCDCEDRSILFSRLVRDLLGLDVVLVYYPNHLATAVCFTETVTGDHLSINGQRFVVCDPTYIGAPVGRTMPQMNNSTAKVILLDK